MAEMTLTRMRLAEGVWEGLLSAQDKVAPRLRLRHRDELVGEPETVEAEDSQYQDLGEKPKWSRPDHKIERNVEAKQKAKILK